MGEAARRRGRPAFKGVETKSEFIRFRVTPTEHRKIIAACEYNNQNVRELLMELLAGECGRNVGLRYRLKNAENNTGVDYEDYDDYDEYGDNEYYDE